MRTVLLPLKAQILQDYVASLAKADDIHITGDDSRLIATIVFGRGPRDPLTVANEIARDRDLLRAGRADLWDLKWEGWSAYGSWVAEVTVAVDGKLTPLAEVVADLARNLANYPCLDDDLLSEVINFAVEQQLEGEEFESSAAREQAAEELAENWEELDADDYCHRG